MLKGLEWWKIEPILVRIKATNQATNRMKPEQEQALKAHLQAIAQILYDDSDPDTMQTLEGIEMTVRDIQIPQLIEHVVEGSNKWLIARRLYGRGLAAAGRHIQLCSRIETPYDALSVQTFAYPLGIGNG